jgi:hypothetical protein
MYNEMAADPQVKRALYAIDIVMALSPDGTVFVTNDTRTRPVVPVPTRRPDCGTVEFMRETA